MELNKAAFLGLSRVFMSFLQECKMFADVSSQQVCTASSASSLTAETASGCATAAAFEHLQRFGALFFVAFRLERVSSKDLRCCTDFRCKPQRVGGADTSADFARSI